VKKLFGRVAVFSGAGSGIGRAIALLFAAEGATVACLDNNEPASIETVTLARADGGDAFGVTADVSLVTEVEAACAKIRDQCGDAHILVNNAGVGIPGTVDALETEAWQKGLDVNVSGAFYLSRALWPGFLRLGRGVIINNSSVMALGGDMRAVGYCSAKAALVGLTKCLAADGARHSIRANCVCPGFVDTPAMRALFDPSSGFQWTRNQLEKCSPLKRRASSREIAQVCLFLASDDASYMTGSIVVVDGGATLGYQGSDVSTSSSFWEP